jgi:hypothetical protein
MVISLENNRMKKYINIIFVLVIVSVSASAQNKAYKVGSDRDKHGCKGSAGYVYSVIKNDCIRVFEQNIRLTEVSPKGSFTSMTSIIFSKDSLKVEVFLPNYNRGQILNKKVSNGKYYWQKGNLVLKRKKGFELFENSKLIYKQS